MNISVEDYMVFMASKHSNSSIIILDDYEKNIKTVQSKEITEITNQRIMYNSGYQPNKLSLAEEVALRKEKEKIKKHKATCMINKRKRKNKNKKK